MAGIVAQIAVLVKSGTQVSLVSSGAIAAGQQHINSLAAPKTIPMRQILAAIGQSKLHAAWDELFSTHGVTIAQTLLTRGDLSHRLSYLNARNTLIGLMEMGVVPIVNENDVVATDEIREMQFGDNDKLSALVAGMLDTHVLVFLTDIGGLYTADPARDAEAELIPEVTRITADIERLAGESASGRGIGGMVSKIKAAETAMSAGTDVVIVDGRVPDALLDAVAGRRVGTRFPAYADRVEARKRWMLAGLGNRGSIRIDAGAAKALESQGRSLLPAGVVDASGSFDRGDTIMVIGPDERTIAYGITHYSSVDVRKLCGVRSKEIEDLLGYQYGEEVVHRNNLVIVDRAESAKENPDA